MAREQRNNNSAFSQEADRPINRVALYARVSTCRGLSPRKSGRPWPWRKTLGFRIRKHCEAISGIPAGQVRVFAGQICLPAEVRVRLSGTPYIRECLLSLSLHADTRTCSRTCLPDNLPDRLCQTARQPDTTRRKWGLAGPT